MEENKDRVKKDSPEGKLASNIIGKLLEFEKYKFCQHKLIASVVYETIGELKDSGLFGA